MSAKTNSGSVRKAAPGQRFDAICADDGLRPPGTQGTHGFEVRLDARVHGRTVRRNEEVPLSLCDQRRRHGAT